MNEFQSNILKGKKYFLIEALVGMCNMTNVSFGSAG